MHVFKINILVILKFIKFKEYSKVWQDIRLEKEIDEKEFNESNV